VLNLLFFLLFKKLTAIEIHADGSCATVLVGRAAPSGAAGRRFVAAGFCHFFVFFALQHRFEKVY
jgi:hypothetical protein